PATLAPSIHVLPAVDRQRRARHEAGVLIYEERDPPGDFFGLAESVDRDLGDDLGQHFWRNGGNHVGIDIAGCDGVNGDIIARTLLGERFGETVDARLGRGVVDLAILSRLAVDRADVDDPAVAA